MGDRQWQTRISIFFAKRVDNFSDMNKELKQNGWSPFKGTNILFRCSFSHKKTLLMASLNDA